MANRIITIGRQFGSGGREVGKKLADSLGIGFYDKELIELAAEKTDIDIGRLVDVDEKNLRGYSNQMPFDAELMSRYGIQNASDILYQLQATVIIEIAKKESCVIVGRCSNYVLRNNPDARHVFLYAELETRVERICRLTKLPEQEARELIQKTDKQRKYYYSYYTDRRWGQMEDYNVTIDCGAVGIEATINMLRALYEGIGK